MILDDGRKETFVSPHLVPIAAICDPELTLGLPPLLTAATGMDAMTHCIEAVLSPVVHPPAEAIGIDGAERAIALARARGEGWQRPRRALAHDDGLVRRRAGVRQGPGRGARAFHALGRIQRTEAASRHAQRGDPAALAGDDRQRRGREIRAPAPRLGLPANADLPQAIADLNARLGLPASLSRHGRDEAHWPGARDYAVSDLATLTNAVPFDADKYDELFQRAL